MMNVSANNKMIFFILFTICVTVKGDFVDTLNKCKVSDRECLKVQLQKLLTEVNVRGFPEYGVNPTDPYDLKGEYIQITDDLLLKFDSGFMTGLKNIVVRNYKLNLEKGSAMYDYTIPSLKIDFNFTVSGSNPMLQALIGAKSLNGFGSLSLNMNNVGLRYTLPFKFVKKDGHVYFKLLPSGKNLKYNIGGVRVYSDNFFINKQDISALVTSLGNSNWRLFVSILEKGVFELMVRSYVNIMENIYANLPDDKLFEDNLEPYL